MKEGVIILIACVFASIYNVLLTVANMESVEGNLETTSALLTIFNTIKDTFVLIVILSKIFS